MGSLFTGIEKELFRHVGIGKVPDTFSIKIDFGRKAEAVNEKLCETSCCNGSFVNSIASFAAVGFHQVKAAGDGHDFIGHKWGRGLFVAKIGEIPDPIENFCFSHKKSFRFYSFFLVNIDFMHYIITCFHEIHKGKRITKKSNFVT